MHSHGEEPKRAAAYPQDCNRTSVADSEIQNFHQVDDALFRGARPHYQDDVYLKLADLGVRTIVNLEGRDEAAKEQAVVERVNATLARQQRPTLVFISFPIRSFFRTVLFRLPDDRVRSLFAQIQDAPKPVFVHCQHGKDRTGMVVALYRLKRGEQANVKAALEEAKHYRFSKWNFGLKRTLIRFAEPARLEALAAPSQQLPRNVCVGRILFASTNTGVDQLSTAVATR